MKFVCFLLGLVSVALAYSITHLQKTSAMLMSVQYPADCLKENCPNQLNACMKDPKCIADIHDCEEKCKTDMPCWELCLAGKGNAPAMNLTKCGIEHQCF